MHSSPPIERILSVLYYFAKIYKIVTSISSIFLILSHTLNKYAYKTPTHNNL